MFLSVIVIARDGNWSPSNGVTYAVFLSCVLCHGILASTLAKVMGKLQTVFVAMNFVLIFATIIALPIGKHDRNDGAYIFAHNENLTTWPTGTVTSPNQSKADSKHSRMGVHVGLAKSYMGKSNVRLQVRQELTLLLTDHWRF